MNPYLFLMLGIGWGLTAWFGTAYFGERRQRNAYAEMVARETTRFVTDRLLAEWTRNTKITVNTVSGAWISMTLDHIAQSSNPARSWNVPISVRLHPVSEHWGDVDQEQAKEHRG